MGLLLPLIRLLVFLQLCRRCHGWRFRAWLNLPLSLLEPPRPWHRHALVALVKAHRQSSSLALCCAACCLAAAIGICPRISMPLATLLAGVQLAVPQSFGKTSHFHHLVLVAAILAAHDFDGARAEGVDGLGSPPP